MLKLDTIFRNLNLATRPRVRSVSDGSSPSTPPVFSTTVNISSARDKLVVTSGGSVTVTYTISGSGTTTATMVHTDGTPPSTLTCDGAQHTVSFTPTRSHLYFINAQDDNGTCVDRLEVIVQQSLTAVDPTASATITTVRDGLWTDTSTSTGPWPGGVLPGVNDVVSNAHVIKANARTDGSGNVLQCARFLNQSGGKLRIYNDNGTAAAVWVTDYVGVAGSELDIDSTYGDLPAVLGLRNRPFHANDTAGNSPDGYADYWNAVDIRGGDLRMRGNFVTPYSRAVGDIAAGDTYIDLQSPVTGWEPSYILALPDTRPTRDVGNDLTDHLEMVLVRGVGPDGSGNANRRVYLVRPTQYAHAAAKNNDGTQATRPWDGDGNANDEDLAVHVTCLSKDAGIFSEDPTGIASLGGDPRAHLYIRGGGRVDCRDAMVSHGMGRCYWSTTYPIFSNNPGYYPQYHRLFPFLTFDLYGPSGGLGYDSTVDELEFKPGDAANVFNLDGPSHRFINCLVMDPFSRNPGSDSLPVSMGTDVKNHGAQGGWVHFYTSYGLYKGNIGFNFFGTCWGIATGNVNRNVFTKNIVIRSDGLANRLDENGIMSQGVGWFLGTYDNWFRNNIAAGMFGDGSSDTYCFGSINVPSKNGNYLPGDPGYWLAFYPNAQGDSTYGDTVANPTNATGFDNTLSAVRQWDNNEGYGAARYWAGYTMGSAGSYYGPITSSVNQTFSRGTAWNYYKIGWFPYGTYRITFDSFFVRGSPSQAPGWTTGTDYLQDEITYLNWDVEGLGVFKAHHDQSGEQFDSDLPDQYGIGRYMIRGGRFIVQRLMDIGLYGTSQSATSMFGVHYIVGGDRTTGSSSDAVTVLHPTGGDPVVFYCDFNDISQLNNFGYTDGSNLTSPKYYELNRWGGHNYDVYPWVQNPDQILPQSYDPHNSPPQTTTATTWGCPEAGMTNQECHDKYSPLPEHRQDVTQTEYQGVLKTGWPDNTTPGMCWGNRLTPASAVSVTWISGPLTGAVPNGKADQVS